MNSVVLSNNNENMIREVEKVGADHIKKFFVLLKNGRAK